MATERKGAQVTILERIKRDNPGFPAMMGGLAHMTRTERGDWMGRAVSRALSKQIKVNRLARGMTLKQLAAKAGIHYITLWRIEHTQGILKCTLTTLARIAAALDCALMCFFVSYSDACCHLIVIHAHGYYVTSFSDELVAYRANEAIELMALEALQETASGVTR